MVLKLYTFAVGRVVSSLNKQSINLDGKDVEKNKDRAIIVSRDRIIRLINGAIRSTIDKHGPITKEFVGSAAKRIYGAIQNVLGEGMKATVKNADVQPLILRGTDLQKLIKSHKAKPGLYSWEQNFVFVTESYREEITAIFIGVGGHVQPVVALGEISNWVYLGDANITIERI